MKRLFVLILAMSLLTPAAHSQSATEPTTANPKFGVKITPFLFENIFHFVYAGEEDNGEQSFTFFETGIFGEFFFNDTIGTQISLAYAKAPKKIKSGHPRVIPHHYCVVKGNFRFRMRNKLCLFVGPQVAWVVRVDQLSRTNSNSLMRNMSTPPSKGPIIDISFGGSYPLENGLILGCEYEAGLAGSSINFKKTFLGSFTLGYDLMKLF